jgi:proline iminopeptidase
MKKPSIFLSLFTLITTLSFGSAPGRTVFSGPGDTVLTGGNKMITIAGGYKVWTKKVGNGKIKVLLLHGGPGANHDGLECYDDFLPKEGMTIYYYDQLGCGNSEVPADTNLWNMPRYIDEVEQVRKGLGIDSFYLVGHSWGGMLAMEYAYKYSTHLKGLVLSDMTAGMKDFISYVGVLKDKLFTTEQKRLFDSLDQAKAYNSAAYNDLLMNTLYARVFCRIPIADWPEPLNRTLRKFNTTIYIQMQGVDEFHLTGNMKNWEFWDKLPAIKVPTLVIGGRYDEMNPESLIREGYLIPNSRTYICPQGSHFSMYDDQQHYFHSVVSFLKQVDKGTFKPDPKRTQPGGKGAMAAGVPGPVTGAPGLAARAEANSATATAAPQAITYLLPDSSVLAPNKVDSLIQAWGGRDKVFFTHNAKDDSNHVMHVIKATPEMLKALQEAHQQRLKAMNAMIGQPAPVWTAKDIDGDSCSLQGYKGKVVVLNFWFTTCPPCIQEMPHLNDLTTAYKGKDVVFLGLSFNDEGSVRAFLQKQPFVYHQIPNSDAIDSLYHVQSWPTSFVIDKNGQVTYAGNYDAHIVETLSAAIDAALVR